MLDDRVRAVLARLEAEDADERARGVPREQRARQVARTTGQFLFAFVSPQTDCHGARRRLQRLLHDRYRLHHVTLQVDHVAQRSQPVEIASRRGDT